MLTESDKTLMADSMTNPVLGPLAVVEKVNQIQSVAYNEVSCGKTLNLPTWVLCVYVYSHLTFLWFIWTVVCKNNLYQMLFKA